MSLSSESEEPTDLARSLATQLNIIDNSTPQSDASRAKELRADVALLERRVREWLQTGQAALWNIRTQTAQAELTRTDKDETRTETEIDTIISLLGWKGSIHPFNEYTGFMPPDLRFALFGVHGEHTMAPDDRLLQILKLDDAPVRLLVEGWVAPSHPPPSSPESELWKPSVLSAVEMDVAFRQPFVGPTTSWLAAAFRQYVALYSYDRHYGRAITVLQSSGMGKSRAMAELANEEIFWPIMACFRGMKSQQVSPDEGFPFPDRVLSDFLRKPLIPASLGHLKGEEISAAFMGALFSVVGTVLKSVSIIKDARARKAAFLSAWSYDDIADFDTSSRTQLFRDVVKHANRLLSDNCVAIKEARQFVPGSLAEAAKYDLRDWLNELYNILIAKAATTLNEHLDSLAVPFLIFIFDECSQWNLAGKDRDPRSLAPAKAISIISLLRIIKLCEQHKRVWYFHLDTTSGLDDVHPETGSTAASLRLRGNYAPLPPWVYLPFDAMVPKPKDRPKTPLMALCLTSLQRYGRPLWSIYGQKDLVSTARRKLLCDWQPLLVAPEDRETRVFAVLSARFLLELTASPAATVVAVAAVKSHMRILTKYNTSSQMVITEAPSEPMLAIAASDLMLEKPTNYRLAMEILFKNLMIASKIVATGVQGETLSRVVLSVARDATMHDMGGHLFILTSFEADWETSSRHYDRPVPNLRNSAVIAVKPFRAKHYLEHLISKDAIAASDLTVWESLLVDTESVYLNFTHFVQLRESIHKCLSFDFLIMCWQRGWALQCVFGQKVLDKILIGYKGDLHQPFVLEKFFLIVVQDKLTTQAAHSLLIHAMTCPYVISPSNYLWKPEFVAILFDMGTRQKFQGHQSSDKVRVTKTRTAKHGVAWEAYGPEDTKESYRIDIRGVESFGAVKDWMPTPFGLHELLPSNNQGNDDFSQMEDRLGYSMNGTTKGLTATAEELDANREVIMAAPVYEEEADA